MKTTFYIPILFLIIAIPCFLFFKTKNTKTDKVKFVQAKENIESRDTIKLYEIIDGKENEYFMDFEIGKDKRVYFYKDTITINLLAGSHGGYYLTIKLIGDEYTSKLTNSGGSWWEDLNIKEQSLELEDFKLVHNGILKGNYFCVADHKNKHTDRVEKVKINGYFEFILKDNEEEAKQW